MNIDAADRNLLFGIMALQLDFINRDQLISGMNAWVLAKDRSLADLLEESGALTAARRQLLEPLVAEHLQQHGNDPQLSLAAFQTVVNLGTELEQVADPQLTLSLARLSTTIAGERYATMSAAPVVHGLRFQILRPHAQGGLGKVSVARDGELNREVALKEIQPQFADDQAARARFILEAEVTGGLEHPSIVPVYGLGTYPDGRPYYAMRFIKGDSLKEVVDHYHRRAAGLDGSTRVVELRQLLTRFIDVCQAIEYAHSRGVLHRDIKPGNVMLGNYGETLVVDWGLAKAQGGENHEPVSIKTERALMPVSGSSVEPTQMGALVGTLHFMSPEQATGRLDLMGPAADVYSLGATLYYVLTGRTAVEGKQFDQIVKAVCTGDFLPPSTINKQVPKALEAICLKAMALEPAERYASAKELANDIERWLADEPVSVHQENLVDRAARWVRRHRTLFGVVCVSALAIMAILSVAVVLIQAQRSEADRQRKLAVGLAEEKSELAQREIDLRKAAQLQAAERLFEQSLLRCQQTDPTAGLLSLVKNLGDAEKIGAQDLATSIRAQIGGWKGAIHSLESAQSLREPVVVFAMRSDGQRMFAATTKGALLLDENGQPLGAALEISEPVVAACFRSQEPWLIVADKGGTITFLDAEKGQSLLEPVVFEEPIAALVLSPDEKYLAVATGNKVVLWSTESRTKSEQEFVHGGAISTIAFSPTAPLLIAGDWQDQTRLWNFESGQEVGTAWQHTGTPLAVTFSPDGATVAVGDISKLVRLWDVAEAKVVGLPLAHQGMIRSLMFSTDGRQLLTASADQTARLWNVFNWQQVGPALKHPLMVNVALFDRSGTQIWTACGDGGLRRWKIANGNATPLPLPGNGNVVAAAFNPQTTALRMLVAGIHYKEISVPGELRRWKVPDGSELGSKLTNDAWLDTGAFSLGGNVFVTPADAGSAQVWNAENGEAAGPKVQMEGKILAYAFSADEKWLLLGTDAGNCQIWNIASGEPVGPARKFSEQISTLALFPDRQRYIVGEWSENAHVVHVQSPSEKPITLHHTSLLSTVAVHPDGKRFLTGTADGCLRLWNADDYTQIGPVMKHSERVVCAQFCLQGNAIIAGYVDGSTRLWDLRTFGEIGLPRWQTKRVMGLAVSQDHRWAATANADWTARLWNIAAADGSVKEIQRECERMTTQHLAADGTLQVLPLSEWLALPTETH